MFDDQTRPLYENMTKRRINCRYLNGVKHGIRVQRFNSSGIQVINNSKKTIDCFKAELRRKPGTDDSVYYMPSLQFRSNEIQYFSRNTTAVKIDCFIEQG